MQHLIHIILVPILSSVYALQSLGLLYINKGICQDSLSVFLGSCLVWAIKQTYCFPAYFFSTWLRGCIEVGWNLGMSLPWLVFVVFMMIMPKDYNCATGYIYILYYTGYIAFSLYRTIGGH